MKKKPIIKNSNTVSNVQAEPTFPTLESLSRKVNPAHKLTPQKVGIMGGSFNPCHNGHIRHALEVMDTLSLTHIELLLSAHHPHKNGLLPFDTRLAYLNASIKDIAQLSVNTMEKELPPPSYTDRILKKWRQQNKTAFPYFLLGTEDFSVLETWHNGFDLPKIAHLVIVSRLGSDAQDVCERAQEYWGNIYISEKEPNNKAFLNNSPCEEKVLKQYFTKFTPNKTKKKKIHNTAKKSKIKKNAIQLKKIKKLYIAIPNIGYCTYVHIPHLEISATRIRKLWNKNKSLRGLIADKANELIQKDTALLKQYW